MTISNFIYFSIIDFSRYFIPFDIFLMFDFCFVFYQEKFLFSNLILHSSSRKILLSKCCMVCLMVCAFNTPLSVNGTCCRAGASSSSSLLSSAITLEWFWRCSGCRSLPLYMRLCRPSMEDPGGANRLSVRK